MRNAFMRLLVLGCFLLGPLGSAIAVAQTVNGRFSGAVLDQTGATIPNASVTITNPATGQKRDTKTGEAGTYVLSNVAPGVYDALTASLAAAAGFKALYVSGAAIAYTRLGRPDIGLVSMSEVAETVALLRDRVPTPLIVDADNGYGNALNVQRTVRMFERAGASAIQIEDQTLPKRCGHLRDKTLIPAAEMVGKVRAALDARASDQTLVIARTDAVAVEGIGPAIERARCYAEAGADVLFVEAPQSREQLSAVAAGLQGLCPLMANIVDGGDTPAG